MASTCSSLNEPSKAEPRWPEVPKTTRCAATVGSGFISKYAVTSFATSMSEDCGAGSPASGLGVMPVAQPVAKRPPGGIRTEGYVAGDRGDAAPDTLAVDTRRYELMCSLVSMMRMKARIGRYRIDTTSL